MKPNWLRCILSLSIFLAASASPSMSMYEPFRIVTVPLERLIDNLTKQENLAPERKAAIEFKLGRLYAMSYALDTCEMPFRSYVHEKPDNLNNLAFSNNPGDRWPVYRQVKSKTDDKASVFKDALNKAIQHYRLSYKLDPNDDVKI